MNRCRTKYPLLLLHGIGARDKAGRLCWGNIPQALHAEGARVFLGHQDAWGTIETNTEFLRRRVAFILTHEQTEKVNIIAHSKGGLEARALATRLGMARNIASITTIATPHHGSKTMEALCRNHLVRTAPLLNLIFSLCGDKKPDYAAACRELCSTACERFNRQTPDAPGVYYQSFAAVMNGPFDDPLLALPLAVVSRYDGLGDGMVSVSSAVWTNYRGIIPAPGTQGVSHVNAAGRQRTYSKAPRGKFIGIREFYIRLVEELKERGL